MKGKLITFELPGEAFAIRLAKKDERNFHPKFALDNQEDGVILVQDHASVVNGQPGFVLGHNIVCLIKRRNIYWIVAEVLVQDRRYFIQPKYLKPYKEPEANEQV